MVATARGPVSSGRRLALWGIAALVGCGETALEEEWAWELPLGQPEPVVPDDNPMSATKVELGRHLFYDRRLSGNGTQSCASCHEQGRGFADGKATPEGSTGDPVPRNAMGLTNVAYRPTLAWANPLLTRLEDHALVPLFGEFPVELGLTGVEDEVLHRLRDDPVYDDLFARAFDERDEPVAIATVVSALAAFQRTMLSYDSPYDRWAAGEADAMSEAAVRGAALFFSERAECYHCHGGFDLTNSTRTLDTPEGVPAFHNTGLYDVDGEGGYPHPNVGLVEFTQLAADMGRFRVPTLRNVEVTGPYMHDGSIGSLREVVEHYVRGGTESLAGPHPGDGADNPFKDPLIRPLLLDDSEIDDLVAFLTALTDATFLEDPRFADPWE